MVLAVRSFVGGDWRDGGQTAQDISPANPSEVVAEVSMGDAALATQAVEQARAAFLGWRNMPAPARGEILRKAAELLDARANDVGRDLTREEGKTLAEGIGETKRAVAILRYFAAQTLEPDGETYPSASPLTFLFARREPVGVITAITPWNFPIAIPAWKIATALAYGNTVVWKPAEIVPLTAMHFLQALVDAGLPPGVLNLVIGRGSVVGEVLTTHPEVDAITFTGSNAVGRKMQVTAVQAGKKIQTELGGKNPAVVLAGGAEVDGLNGGYYIRPTVLSGLDKNSRVVREEIFGPVAALLPARNYAEAVQLANDTPFGLTSSLFTRDLTEALRFANDIRTGVVKVNQESAGLEYHVPFGGMKESSSGTREQGKAAKEFFTQWKTVYMDQSPQ